MIKVGALYLPIDDSFNTSLSKSIGNINNINKDGRSLIDIRPVAVDGGVMIFYLYNEREDNGNKKNSKENPLEKDFSVEEIKQLLKMQGGCSSCE